MTKVQAWIAIIVLAVIFWPIFSMAIFEDRCKDGFFKAYFSHLAGWLVVFLIIFALTGAIWLFTYSLGVALS